jgi:antitoxin YefM
MSIETIYNQTSEQYQTWIDKAVDDREVIIVRRQNGDAAAIIAADELESLIETAHLLRSPKNAERLLTALARARKGEVEPLSISELKREMGSEI